MSIKTRQTIIVTRLGTWLEGISTSYWFIPVCMMLLSFCFYGLSVQAMAYPLLSEWVVAHLPDVSRDGSHQILTTIASATITATSIAFSMTIVALTMASSQFGPRLLRTFMYDKGTQIVLGLLVSTFLFCMFSLHKVSGNEPEQAAMNLLSGWSVILVTINTFAIVYFIHHIARFIQADEVIHRCYTDCIDDIDNHLPATLNDADYMAIPEQLLEDSAFQIDLNFPKTGYVQTVNIDKLLSTDIDGVEGLDIHIRPGDYVFPDTPVITVHSRYNHNPAKLYSLLENIVLGAQRTPIQDPEFAIGQLVELALRALSPGINDPVTAISCLDKLTACCLAMSKRTFPAPCITHKQNQLWIKRRTFTLDSVIDKAFNQIRQAGRTHMAIGLHILSCLKTLLHYLPSQTNELVVTQASATYELVMSTSQSDIDKRKLESAFTPFK